MNEWKVYSTISRSVEVEPELLGDYLAIKYLAGNMSVVYVDDNGSVKSAMSHQVKLVRSRTAPAPNETIHSNKRRP